MLTYLQSVLGKAQQGDYANIGHLDYILRAQQDELKQKIAADKFWFVTIPRTSSSSIQISLGAQFGYPHGKVLFPGGVRGVAGADSFLLPPHTPSFLARDILGPELWRDCSTFSVVRHPYSWSVSLWRYTKTYWNLGFSDGDFLTFLREFERNANQDIRLRTFHPSNYFQHDYLVENNADKFLVKNILKYEDRAGIEDFLKSIGLKSLPSSNKVAATDSASYQLSEAEKAVVRKVFEKDFDLLGY
jgi:hypothetical protein